jgi:hypothetical protein
VKRLKEVTMLRRMGYGCDLLMARGASVVGAVESFIGGMLDAAQFINHGM